MPPRLLASAVVALALSLPAFATERSAAAVRQFKRENPCPATGQPRGRCPGWIVDHVKPLCAGGSDRPENMQWQTVQDAKVKDRLERRGCRRRLSHRRPPPGKLPERHGVRFVAAILPQHVVVRDRPELIWHDHIICGASFGISCLQFCVVKHVLLRP